MDIRKTAARMVTGDKGLLAMDESTGTADKRFATLGIPQTVEMRRTYREWTVESSGFVFSTPSS